MRNNQFAVVLASLLLFSTLITAFLIARYTLSVRKLQTYAPSAAQVAQSRSLVQSLINDTIEYSKRNPDVIPLLQQVGLPVGNKATVPATTSAPISKPTTK
ncbi:MAG: hypothetical protein JWQ71_4627 [Pedosphaera sp.]|nr:hypothetical protein [Pedosphaera sp.]